MVSLSSLDAFSVSFGAENNKALMIKIASVREVVLGAPLRVVLKHLAARTLAPDVEKLVALVHRPKESFFLVPRVRSSPY